MKVIMMKSIKNIIDYSKFQSFYEQKKARYTVRITVFILIYALSSAILEMMTVGVLSSTLQNLVLALIVSATVMVSVNKGNLVIPINTLILFGIYIGAQMLSYQTTSHMYIRLVLGLLLTSIVHTKKYQFHFAALSINVLILCKALNPTGSSTAFMLNRDSISLVGSTIIFTLTVYYLSQVIDSEIRRSEKLRRITTMDSLTRLYNRQKFDECLQLLECSDSAYYMLIDLDHFKKINDTLGHQFGDKVLVQFSQVLQSTYSDTDFIFRWGGEEFLVILPDTNSHKGRLAADKLHTALKHTNFSMPWPLTVSIGATYAIHDLDFDADRYIHLADNALYAAKKQGRNQTIQLR